LRAAASLCQKAAFMSHVASLVIHPATPCKAVRRIAASIRRDAGGLRISYRVEGDIESLRLPPPGGPVRTDLLWQHSCFEAFLRADGNDSYHEFNFAPSGAWAAYRFAERRRGGSAPDVAEPSIECRRDGESFVMTVALALDALPELAARVALHAGLAAVIEDARGVLSYWALAHGATQPDFHDPATFRLRLRAQ
jgi:hypothetical protein